MTSAAALVGMLLLAIPWRLARHERICRLIGYTLSENAVAASWMRDTGAHGHWGGYKLVFTWDLEAPRPFPARRRRPISRPDWLNSKNLNRRNQSRKKGGSVLLVARFDSPEASTY